jgi:hypothetical protein
MIENFHIYFTRMKQNKNIMDQLSFKMNGMYSYHVHKSTSWCMSSIVLITNKCKLHNRIALRGSSKEKYVGWVLCWKLWTLDGFVNGANGIF